MPIESPQTPVVPLTRWMTTAEIAAHFRWSRPKLYELIELGLPNHQPGGKRTARMYDFAEVDEWVRSKCSTPDDEPDEQVA